MPHWYDIEEDRLVQELNDGLITDAEFRRLMRDLNQDLREEALERAERAYEEAME